MANGRIEIHATSALAPPGLMGAGMLAAAVFIVASLLATVAFVVI